MTASYSSSPYFQFYFGNIENVISKKTDFLIDLNMELTESVLKMLKLNIHLTQTTHFEPIREADNDFRYKISPKKKSQFVIKEYMQVFNTDNRFVHGLSIIDLIFNMGPEALDYL